MSPHKWLKWNTKPEEMNGGGEDKAGHWNKNQEWRRKEQTEREYHKLKQDKENQMHLLLYFFKSEL